MTPILNQLSNHLAEGTAKRAPQQAADDGGFADLLDSAWDSGLAARETPKVEVRRTETPTASPPTVEPPEKPAQPGTVVSMKGWDRLALREELAPLPLEMPVEEIVLSPVSGREPDKDVTAVKGGDPLAVLLMSALPVMARTDGAVQAAPGTPVPAPLRIENSHAVAAKVEPIDQPVKAEVIALPEAKASLTEVRPAAPKRESDPDEDIRLGEPAPKSARPVEGFEPIVAPVAVEARATAAAAAAQPAANQVTPARTLAPARSEALSVGDVEAAEQPSPKVETPVSRSIVAAPSMMANYNAPLRTMAELPAQIPVPPIIRIAFQTMPAPARPVEDPQAAIPALLEAMAAPAGPAPTMTAPILVPAPVLALDPATQPELVQAARAVTEAEVTGLATERSETLKLQLKPVELGSVVATLHAARGVLSVELVVETAEALHRLKHEADAIGQALRDIGLDVDKVSVQASIAVQTPDRAQTASQTFNQTGSDAGANFEARGERNSSESRQNNQRDQRERSDVPSMAGDGRAAAGRYI